MVEITNEDVDDAEFTKDIESSDYTEIKKIIIITGIDFLKNKILFLYWKVVITYQMQFLN